ncbi:ABC transporter permease [Allochromatium palmeri]|uniref:Transport permease protein n=2 Tax=Allochromatium palmeri TaxID=231048 RepID=A0A6N8EC73_9GAMM|nr:ABC transporter permease [Allochromatium palmeri]
MTSSLVRLLNSLSACFSPLVTHRQLIIEMTQREVLGRYRGSFMGIAWSLLHPLLMLMVYTFVFSYVFESRWGLPNESRADFAIMLFVGMIVHGFFAECLNRAPNVILHNPNYVKKVIFPLEILPWIIVLAAVFHALISVIALLLVQLLLKGSLPATALLLPIVVLPFVLLTAGLSLILASIGTFVRDVGQAIGVLTTILLFLSPVFYPISRLPAVFQFWMTLNPLSFMIEESRKLLVLGLLPDITGWLLYCGVALVIFWLGHWWFQFTRGGFADVL